LKGGKIPPPYKDPLLIRNFGGSIDTLAVPYRGRGGWYNKHKNEYNKHRDNRLFFFWSKNREEVQKRGFSLVKDAKKITICPRP